MSRWLAKMPPYNADDDMFQHDGSGRYHGLKAVIPKLSSSSTDSALLIHQVGAVVVGFDRHINYYKIQYACLCIRENPGCLFIATNLDAVTHLTDAQEWAGNGAMVGAIKGEASCHDIMQPLVWCPVVMQPLV